MAGDRDKPEETASDLFVDPLGGLEDLGGVMPDPGADAPMDLGTELGISLDGGETAQMTSGNEATEMLGEAAGDPDITGMNAMIEEALPSAEIPAFEAPPNAESELETRGDAAARFFDVTIRGLRDARLAGLAAGILKKFPAEAQGPDFEAKLTELGAYRATRLGEFHAYALAVHLHRAGLDFQLAMPGFGDAETAPETPEILETETVASTGAVAVALPSKPGELLLATMGDVPGYTATQSKGIVTAHGGIARAFFREEEKAVRLESKIQALQLEARPAGGKRNLLPRAEIDKVFQTLLERLQREAFRRGANGVVGIQITGFSESSSFNPDADQIRLIASGTAVLLEPVK